MSLSLVALARVFGRMRAPALLLATAACLSMSAPAAAQQQLPTLDIIRPPTWRGWEDLQQSTCTQAEQAAGTCFATSSAADCVTTGVNRIDCFARVHGGVVARRQWDGQTWRPWGPLQGMAMHYFSNAAPECVVAAQGRIDCIARSSTVVQPHPSAPVFHFPVTGAASWTPMNQGVLSSDAECLSPSSGRIDCFGRGVSGELLQSTNQGQGWSTWTSRGDQLMELTKPSCVAFNGRIVCVFVTPAAQLREFSVLPSGNGPSFRDVTTPGAFSASYGAVQASPKCVVNGDIHCVMPAISGNAYILAWVSSNGSSPWSMRNAGSNSGGVVGLSFGDRQTMRYDWDCVVMQANRLDCMELVVQGMRARGGERLSRVVLRHGALTPSTGGSSWSDVALSTAPSSFPTFLDCVSWGADRIDCFATGSPVHATALLHAWLQPPDLPVLRPNRPLPPIRSPG